MKIQIYLILVIFSAVLSQGIFVISDENIKESSDPLIRKKRIIDKTASGRWPEWLHRAPYIVNILRNGISHCAGVILESDIILTVSNCVSALVYTRFSILSGSLMRNRGTRHNITNRIYTSASGLAIFKIVPPINFHQDGNGKIELFTGVLPPHPFGRFSGWGCTGTRLGRNIYPEQLMITRLPIISEQQCRHVTSDPVRRICTLDRSRRRATCMGDEGGPLVSIRNNQLIGVLLFSSFEIGIYPDIFVNLIEPIEQQWVTSKMNILRN